MIEIKPGVSIRGLTPEIVLAAVAAHQAYEELADGAECVITSCTEGKHGRASLHYVGYAIDIRTRTLTTQQTTKVAEKIRRALGAEFDVVLEQNHIHIEFQPKTEA